MYKSLIKNKRLILILPLLLAAAIFIPSHIPLAHAATGLVCIVFPSTSTTCPTSSPSIGPVSVGQNFTVGVRIQGSDAMGGLDIYVKSNSSAVTPVSAALGTLIASPSLTSICINGSSAPPAGTGSCTVNTANGAGVVEVTTIESTGTNECGGISPCSGLAFTITYHAVSATTNTILTYPSAAGCATTSIVGTTTCVLVADALGTALPETIQTPAATVIAQKAAQGVCITYPSNAGSCSSVVPTYGPFAVGQTYTIGVFVQNSKPIGGFVIYVGSDSNFLHPLSASLGTLITNPSLTDICVNGAALNGTCTPNTANGPDVVECSTIEASGVNDAGTGLLCTITYFVVHPTPLTPIFYPTSPGCAVSSVSSPPNTCVLLTDSFGTTLPENATTASATIPHVVDATKTGPRCISPVVVGVFTTCTATVNDTAPSGGIFSVGGIKWSTDGIGVFSPFTCTLSQSSTTQSVCITQYLPLAVGTRITHITAIYDPNFPPSRFDVKDPSHSGSIGNTTLTVLPQTPGISTQVIIDQTGQPPLGGQVSLGLSEHDNAFLFGGFPIQGVVGTVTYTLFPNGVCTAGTGIFSSTVTVRPANDVPSSASFRPNATGTFSFNAVYHPATTDNNAVTSACEPFTVVPPPIEFNAGKLHWTHHLSLSKSGNLQSWTADVLNPLSTNALVVVRIVGFSAINPSLGFDVVCGVTCVNTPTGFGVLNSTGLTPVTVFAGAKFSFSFSQAISPLFVNQKISFTATLYWTSGTSTIYTNSFSTKSGSFAVVP